MGKANIITKQYMQDNVKFADVCNFYLYNGNEVIKPEDLKEKDVTELALSKSLQGVVAVEKIRDILKKCCIKTANGVTYLIIGIENQADVHYAMVAKNLLYDALNYAAQVDTCAKKHRKDKDISGAEFLSGFAKEDTLVPVVTLTIYWKAGKWDGARRLHDMFHVNDCRVLNYVQDYKLNLIVPEEIEDFDRFKTELGAVLDFVKCSDSGVALKQALESRGEKWNRMSKEAINLLNECFDAKIVIDESSEEGAGNVCKGIRELEEMSRAEGEARLSKLISILCKQEKYEEVQLVTSSVEARKEYYTLYNL